MIKENVLRLQVAIGYLVDALQVLEGQCNLWEVHMRKEKEERQWVG